MPRTLTIYILPATFFIVLINAYELFDNTPQSQMIEVFQTIPNF